MPAYHRSLTRVFSLFHFCRVLTALCLIMLVSACRFGGDSTDAAPVQKEETQARATIEDVEKGIRSYISRKVKEDDGYFNLKTDSLQLNLRLVRVHTEYLSVLGNGHYFACVDLADTSGDVFDVDFFMKGKPDSMQVTQTTVHKLNGKPIYAWQQMEDKTWQRVPVENAARELLGVKEGRDEFEFRYQVILPEMKEPAELWLPLATDNRFQQVEVISQNLPGRHKILKEREFGNSILYLQLQPEKSGKKVEVVYQVSRVEAAAYRAEQPDLQKYQLPSELIPTHGRFKEIVDEVLAGKELESPLVQARALYDYVIDNVRYAKQGKYGTGDARYACDAKSGNCTEFHSLFIALARTANIPARFAIGAAIPAERNEGGVNGYHCWAEFYANGKWWPVDISEGDKYTALATYYFGHHPANRIELSHGRDLKVSPGPQSGAIPFFAYPILEVGAKQLKPETHFSFSRPGQS